MSEQTQNPSASPNPASQGQGQPVSQQAPNQGTPAQNALRLITEHVAAQVRSGQPKPAESRTQEAVTQSPELAPYTEKLSAVETELAALKAERAEEKRQRAMEEERARIAQRLSPTDFPLISRVGAHAHKVVVDQMLAHYQDTGDWLSEAEAAKVVEAQLKDLATKLAPPPAEKAAPPSSHSWERTITSGMSGEVSRQPDLNPDPSQWDQEFMSMLRRAQNG